MNSAEQRPLPAEIIFSPHSQRIFSELQQQDTANPLSHWAAPVLACQLTQLFLFEHWLAELEAALIHTLRKYRPVRRELNHILRQSPLTKLANIQRLWMLFKRQRPHSQLLLYFDHHDLQRADIHSLVAGIQALQQRLPSSLMLLLPETHQNTEDWNKIDRRILPTTQQLNGLPHSTDQFVANKTSTSPTPSTDATTAIKTIAVKTTPEKKTETTIASGETLCAPLTPSASPTNPNHHTAPLSIRNKPHPLSRGEQQLHQYLASDSELQGLFLFNQSVISTRKNRFCVDLLWHHGKLIVEVDGYRYHSNREQFRQDRHRDYELVLSGYRVLRLTDAEIQEDIALAVEKIRDLVRLSHANARK